MDGQNSFPAGVNDFEYPGEGSYDVFETVREGGAYRRFRSDACTVNTETEVTLVDANFDSPIIKEKPKLGQLASTAISANDITSSILYTAGLTALHADIYAPFCLVLVEVVLYLFRKIYVEVVTALPLNGGSYTALLNTNGKKLAAFAGCLSFLSYVATAVVSVGTGVDYLRQLLIDSCSYNLSTTPFAIFLLLLFMVLSLLGLRESAVTATVIFLFHMVTLVVLIVCSVYWAFCDHWSLLGINYSVWPTNGVASKLIFGYSSGMLGITGFESSANFVEEQQKGVFSKTLRNMWYIVAIMNPLVSVLSFAVLPKAIVTGEESSTFLLYQMAKSVGSRVGGNWLAYLVGVDGFLVLNGAVLTAFVGVQGLLKRMGQDSLLPKIFLNENRWTHTPHIIIITFCLLCCCLYLMTNGNVDAMGNVYAISFLSVMFLFGFANLLLKYGRSLIRREEKANVVVVFIAMGMMLFAWIGNVVKDPTVLLYFLTYFGPIYILALSMFYRVMTLKALINYLEDPYDPDEKTFRSRVRKFLIRVFQNIIMEPVAFLSRDCDLRVLNKVAIYCQKYESTHILKIVHIFESRDRIPHNLLYNIKVLDYCYSYLRLDVVLIHGKFSPEMVQKVSKILKVPTNRMMLGCPAENFPYDLSELGGMRIIVGKHQRNYHYLLEVLKSKVGNETLSKMNIREFQNTLSNLSTGNSRQFPSLVRAFYTLPSVAASNRPSEESCSSDPKGRFQVNVLDDSHLSTQNMIKDQDSKLTLMVHQDFQSHDQE
eukprot:Sdes_comp9575_c0_seq1m1054